MLNNKKTIYFTLLAFAMLFFKSAMAGILPDIEKLQQAALKEAAIAYATTTKNTKLTATDITEEYGIIPISEEEVAEKTDEQNDNYKNLIIYKNRAVKYEVIEGDNVRLIYNDEIPSSGDITGVNVTGVAWFYSLKNRCSDSSNHPLAGIEEPIHKYSLKNRCSDSSNHPLAGIEEPSHKVFMYKYPFYNLRKTLFKRLPIDDKIHFASGTVLELKQLTTEDPGDFFHNIRRTGIEDIVSCTFIQVNKKEIPSFVSSIENSNNPVSSTIIPKTTSYINNNLFGLSRYSVKAFSDVVGVIIIVIPIVLIVGVMLKCYKYNTAKKTIKAKKIQEKNYFILEDEKVTQKQYEAMGV